MSRQPRASGYFRTGYGQDLALIGTRLERIEPRRARPRAAGVSVLRLAVPARSRLPGVSRLRRRAVADAAHRLCRPDLARPCRADGGRRFHGRHPVPGSQRAVLDHAAGGGAGRRPARRHLRTAVAAAARALSRGQHARAAFRGDLYRRRVRIALGLLDRHRHRSAEARRRLDQRRPRLVLHSAGGGGGDAAASASTSCARAPAGPGARSARTRPSPRRSASASPATSCSPSSSAPRSPRSPARCSPTTAASSRSRRSRCSSPSSTSPW